MPFSDIVAGVKAKLTASKPYLVGAVIGAIVTVIVQFNAGWVVTAGTHAQELAKARISAVATVCAQQASKYWTTEGHELSALEGWTNEQRDELAKRFTPKLEKAQESEVADLCDDMLRPT